MLLKSRVNGDYSLKLLLYPVLNVVSRMQSINYEPKDIVGVSISARPGFRTADVSLPEANAEGGNIQLSIGPKQVRLKAECF